MVNRRFEHELAANSQKFATFNWRMALIGHYAEDNYVSRRTSCLPATRSGKHSQLVNLKPRTPGPVGAEIAASREGLIACSIDDDRN